MVIIKVIKEVYILGVAIRWIVFSKGPSMSETQAVNNNCDPTPAGTG
jgi:hypothetical protein